MPVMKCKKDGKDGFKWGESGVCFIGDDAEEKAAAVGIAIHSQMNQNLFELSENSFTRVQVAKVGKFNHQAYGKFSITLDDLKSMRKNFLSDVRRQKIDGKPVLPFDYSHAEGEEAAGWITDLQIDKDSEGVDALFADVDWTEKAKKKIKEKEFKFTSPSIARGYTDSETGKKFNIVLKGAALTNIPFLRGMEAVYALSEERQAAFNALKLSGDSDETIKLGENMPELIAKFKAMSPEDKAKFLAECGLMKKDKKLSEELEKVKTDLAESQKYLKLSEEENKKLKEDFQGSDELEKKFKLQETEIGNLKKDLLKQTQEREAEKKEREFDVMLSEGKVCEAQRKPFLSGDMAEFAKNAQPIKLNESGSNAKGDEGGDAEVKVMELAEKKMEKDKNLSLSSAYSLVLSENPELAKKLD